MGSGKGKTRRALAAAQLREKTAEKTDKIVFQQDKWVEFVKSGSIWEEEFYGYYLEENPNANLEDGRVPPHLEDEDYRKLMIELFTDAVSVGAIALPEPYNCEDFEFVSNKGDGFGELYDGGYNILCVRLAGQTRHMQQITVPNISWEYNMTMSSLAIVSTLERVADEISRSE